MSISEIVVADTPEAWMAAGFTVDPDGGCRIGGVRIRLVGRDAGVGIVGWSLRDVSAELVDIDGVPTSLLNWPAVDPAIHLNGVTRIDHVVLLSPDLRRTVTAFEAIGASPRRERDGELGGQPIRQIFFRLGEVVVEVIGSADAANEGPSTLWGITYDVEDIDATAGYFGERTSPVKDAVQSGRRITTLRHRDLGLSVRTALISPRPPRDDVGATR